MKYFLIILLLVPTAWELYNDRKGDLNKGEDVFIRVALCLASAALILRWFPVADSLMLSLSLHFLLFDYAIAWWLIKKGIIEVSGAHWFSYMGGGYTDSLKFWRNLNPWWKLAVRAAVFGGALTVWIV